MNVEQLQTADERVAVYPEGERLRIVWRDPVTGKRRQVRRTGLDAAAQAVREVVLGLDGHVDPTATNGHRRVADLAAWYLDPASRTSSWSVEYQARQGSILATWVLPGLGSLRCADLSHHDLRRVVQAARAKGLAESSVQSIASTLSGMIRAGKDAGFIDRDAGIAQDIYRRQGSKTAGESTRWVNPRTLPDAEHVAELAAYMGGRWEPWLELQTLLAAYTGLRYGEQAALTADAVSLDQRSIDVTVALSSKTGTLTPPKWGRHRTTFVPGLLLPLLAARLDEVGPRDLLFPHVDGGPRRAANFHASRFGPARVALGWERRPDAPRRYRWSWHTLRHHFCTWCLAPPPDGAGLEVADVAYFAGHHSPEFTYARYVGRRDGALQRARQATATAEPLASR